MEEDGEQIAGDPTIIHGPCCVCEQVTDLHDIVMLPVKASTPGKGWGCFTCGLDVDGAIAVVCSDCILRPDLPEIRFACAGYPSDPGRVPRADLQIPHEHNKGIHANHAKMKQDFDVRWN